MSAATPTSHHFSTRILPSTTWTRKDDIFFCITKPIRLPQGLQAQGNKGEAGALQYSLSMARGEGLQVFVVVFKRPVDGQALSYMGFRLSFAGVGAREVLTPGVKIFYLRDEREWLESTVGLAFSIVGARASSMHSDFSAFLGKAAWLLSDDKHELKDNLNYWKELKKDWLTVTSRGEPAVARRASAPLDLENMIKSVRTIEKRAQEHKRLGLLRWWITPVQRGIATKVFN